MSFDCNWIEDGIKCLYKTDRIDNLDRHIREVHKKLKEICDCGKSVNRSNIDRHKRSKSCRLRNQRQTKSKKKQMNVPPVCPQTEAVVDTPPIVNEKEYRIETIVKVLTLSDGSKMIIPSTSQIQIEECIVTLTVSPNETITTRDLIQSQEPLNEIELPSKGGSFRLLIFKYYIFQRHYYPLHVDCLSDNFGFQMVHEESESVGKNLDQDQEAILHENEGSFKTITQFSLARFRNFNLFYYSQRIGKAKLFIIAQNRLNAMILVTLNMK